MTVISKNVYIDKLDEKLDKYNKTYRTIKVKLADEKMDTCIDDGVEKDKKDPKFKVVDHVKYQNTKIFLHKDTLQIGLKKSL